ncbi:hypothetical protein ABZ806_20720 [Spirillospora sp. NPDC047418]
MQLLNFSVALDTSGAGVPARPGDAPDGAEAGAEAAGVGGGDAPASPPSEPPHPLSASTSTSMPT